MKENFLAQHIFSFTLDATLTKTTPFLRRTTVPVFLFYMVDIIAIKGAVPCTAPLIAECLFLSSYKTETLEIDFLLFATLVGDAQLGCCHAAKFVACVDDRVVVVVVQQRNLFPCTVYKEF